MALVQSLWTRFVIGKRERFVSRAVISLLTAIGLFAGGFFLLLASAVAFFFVCGDNSMDNCGPHPIVIWAPMNVLEYIGYLAALVGVLFVIRTMILLVYALTHRRRYGLSRLSQ